MVLVWQVTNSCKALILPVIIDIFIGNTVATNLSTEMSTRLNTDTERERYQKYEQSLHTAGATLLSRTESLLMEYSIHTLRTKNHIRKGHACNVVVSAGAEIL